MIGFESKNFGQCEVICMLNDVAIIKLEKNIEKYVVAVGFDYENRIWQYGCYCKDLKEAAETFNCFIEDFYMAIFKI